MDIEKLINELIEARGMTLTELTAQLGYQSKTSLVRIMKNQASQRALDTFARKVNERLSLSLLEQERLNEVLDYMRWQEDYDSSREMFRFLRGEVMEDADVWLEEVGAPRQELFRDRYWKATEIFIKILNCYNVPVFQCLRRFMRERGARIDHYLRMTRNPLHVIHASSVVVPLFHEKEYMCYSWHGGDGDVSSVRGVLNADVMVIQYRAEDGAALEDLITFDRKDHGYVLTGPRDGGFLRLLAIQQSDFSPIKRTFFLEPNLGNYVEYSRGFAQLEYNRSIYKIKPDVSIDWIPEDILEAALLEGGIPGIAEDEELLNELRQVYHGRVRNTFEKRRVARTIMKRSAMLRFARTGRKSDHFWGMRPFTQEERVRILKTLLKQVESNPYFDVYFLKDNDLLRDGEIAYYENIGMLILDSNTSYALEDGHSEIMIEHKEFSRLFKEYFERSLLVSQVVPYSETIAFLNELIKIASGDS